MKVLTLSPDILKQLPAKPEPGLVYHNLHDGLTYVYDGQLQKWMRVYDELQEWLQGYDKPQNEEVE